MTTTSQRSTVVGIFENTQQADKAVSELMSAGFGKDQIGVAMRHDKGAAGATATGNTEGTEAGSGATTGALAGMGLGALAGLGVLAGVIPVIGPAIAAGTLGVMLSNVAAGAGIAGLTGALVGAGMPEHEAKHYHDEFEKGRTIVSVNTNGRADEAMAILRVNGASDMGNRSTSGTSI